MPIAKEPVTITVKVQRVGVGQTIRRSFDKRPNSKQIAAIVNEAFKEVYR